MKKLLPIIFILSTYLNAQEEVTGGELNFDLINDYGKVVEINMSLISDFCWTANSNGDHNKHDLTNIYLGGTLNNSTQSHLEFLGCWEHPSGSINKTFGLGLYRFEVRVNGGFRDYFEIDYRTSSLPETFNLQSGGDINLKFDAITGKIYYGGTTLEFPESTSIWIQRSWITLIKTELEPHPPEDLVQTATIGCPVLNWVHPVDCEYRTGYNIYRSISGGNYNLAGSTDCSTNTFTDVGIQLNGGGTANYKVKAKNGTRESISSNIISVSIVAIDKKQFKLENQLISSPVLLQNYPNPFNPITTINYSIPSSQNVSIIIYDILGKKVIDLVNGYKEAGDHSIEFDGSNLNSGVYIYIMRADNFVQTKRLVLVK